MQPHLASMTLQKLIEYETLSHPSPDSSLTDNYFFKQLDSF